MNEHFSHTISMEKFAAYLDGNLTPDEMTQIADIVAQDANMSTLVRQSEIVVETMETDENLKMSLPDEITSLDFSLPELGESMSHDPDVTVLSDDMQKLPAADPEACIILNEDPGMAASAPADMSDAFIDPLTENDPSAQFDMPNLWPEG